MDSLDELTRSKVLKEHEFQFAIMSAGQQYGKGQYSRCINNLKSAIEIAESLDLIQYQITQLESSIKDLDLK